MTQARGTEGNGQAEVSGRIIARTALALLATIFVARPSNGDSIPIININPATQVQQPPLPPGPGQYEGFNEAHGDGMVGWCFSLLQPITVSQVGWYDDGQDGLSRDFQVGLWSGATQLLGSPTAGIVIPGGTQATLNGVWRVISLPAPLDLLPGDYVLGGLDSATTPDVIKFVVTVGHENDPSLTGSRLTIGAYFEGVFGGPGFHRPTVFGLNSGLELGPMLFINVPEPSTLVLLGLGFVGLIGSRLRLS